ncbi:MAG: PAS domain-containing sensor histidine kinase, partial [Vicinamibacteria bacterium]
MTDWILPGTGEAAALIRTIDWAATPLGPMATWPQSLKTTVATMLHSRHPMFLWWGADLIQIYNDAYVPSFGKGKHPKAMGQGGKECWPEIWSIIGPQIADVMERGIPSWHEDA